MRGTFCRPVLISGAISLCLSLGALVSPSEPAQPRSGDIRRIATTVGALNAYPVFFHAHQVRVRGRLSRTPEGVNLEAGDTKVLLVGSKTAGLSSESAEREVLGLFVDVGRLTEHDPRVSALDIAAISERRVGKPWPSINELPLILVESIDDADPFPAPSVRALALAPERYLDARVSVIGRFRGRNLYGEQPDAPGRSRWDFVLQSADAAIWVVNLKPSGQGFSLNVDSRIDTEKWVEVSGVVRRDRDLVILDGISIRRAEEPPAPVSAPASRVPMVGPRPEVVFSIPTAGETDVAPTTGIRIQFSRDLVPTSFAGQVRVTYVTAGASEGDPGDAGIPFAQHYDAGARVLEIRAGVTLQPFRTVRVELLDGVKATDGAQLVPWSAVFTTSGG